MNDFGMNHHPRSTHATDRNDLRIQVTDDASLTLIRTDTDVSYHSSSGAISETEHVYLKNSGMQQRLGSGRKSRVLEIGLGTGMAMLMTVDLAVEKKAPLHYVAVEWDWLSEGLTRSLQPDLWLKNRFLAEDYLRWRAAVGTAETPSSHVWTVRENQHVVIHQCDAETWSDTADPFDTIYFDPFAPEISPNLWQLPVLERMFAMLSLGGTLVTYCVKRQVRDRLSAAGFDVQKTPGPRAGKREVLIATKSVAG